MRWSPYIRGPWIARVPADHAWRTTTRADEMKRNGWDECYPMKFPRCSNGTVMQLHRPCWTGTKGKVTTFLEESSLCIKPELTHVNQTWNANQMNAPSWFSSSKESASYAMCCEGDVHCGYDIDRVILHHAVPPRQIVKTVYYCMFLQHHLHPALRIKWWHFVVHILHDNAKNHTAAAVMNLLCCWQWEILEHPPYLSDMSPCDYDLYAKVKEPLWGTRYNTRDELIHAIGQSIRNSNKMDALMVCDAFKKFSKRL